MNQHTRVAERPIPFIDVAAQRRRLGRAIDDAIARVLAHCQFIQGPEVKRWRRSWRRSAARVMRSPARAGPTRFYWC
jgi:hypothetical protein